MVREGARQKKGGCPVSRCEAKGGRTTPSEMLSVTLRCHAVHAVHSVNLLLRGGVTLHFATEIYCCLNHY